jgi:hypothetical protein
MALEEEEAELGVLLGRMQNAPQDKHELCQQIRLKLNELKAFGMPLPEDLVQFERDLEAELAGEASENVERSRRIEELLARRARTT